MNTSDRISASGHPQRLLALDVMRGITIAGMILVNNPGSWSHIYPPLRHAEWCGLTPTDLIFPFFMFIMGVSICFPLSKVGYTATRPMVLKILRRSLLLLFIGWGICLFGMMLRGIRNPEVSTLDAILCFDHLRIPGVLPRLAVCYCISALITLLLRPKWIACTVAGLLLLYTIILFAGNGLQFSTDNILYKVDIALLGENHLYSDTVQGITLHFDPEGLLSTIPSIAHCLIGVLCGMKIIGTHDNRTRAINLFVAGVCLTMAGFLLDYGLPISKKLWTPTFVLVSCGLAASLFGLLIWVIDIKGFRHWCGFFKVYGINPLFLFVLAGLLSIIFSVIPVLWHGEDLTFSRFLYEGIFTPLAAGDPTLGSLFQAIFFILLTWLAGLFLYHRRIYIKL